MTATVPPVTVEEAVAALNVREQNGVARLDFGRVGFVYFVDAASWHKAVAAVEPRVFVAGRNPETRWIFELGAQDAIFDRLDDLSAFPERWYHGTPHGEAPRPLAETFHRGKAWEAEYRAPDPCEAVQSRDRLRLEYRD